MTIDPASWPELSKLLDDWLDLPEASRPGWLAALGPEHSSLLPTLRQIMVAQARPGWEDSFNSLPRFDSALATAENFELDTGFSEGSRVGPYRLLRKVGQGGMSVVWLAEPAIGDIKRLVALKLPLITFYNPSLAERFARERDILAQLTHPNMARLYDAGITAGGQPYLAMEFVEGKRITTYCDEATLGLEKRLQLFLQVLQAVQYAHTNLVVHRDLKPGNILVTESGEVRLVDFGIAKLLIEGEADETELTRIGGRALTLDYASPEQAAGDAVSAASDVYSLGVILYEILTGERPYKLKRVPGVSLANAIVGANIVPPSQSAVNQNAAEARSTTAKKLTRSLRGDLDTIVLKALEKQPRDRYTTADAFAADLQRFLEGEPVVARPPSRWYKAAKFVRRNKVVVGAVAAVVAALSAGLAVSLRQAHIARVQTESAKAVQTFLLDIFRANSSENPDPVKARQTTARELLDAGAKQIDSGLNTAPEAKLAVLETLFDLYNDLGLKEQSGQLAKKRIALTKEIYGPDNPEVATALVGLALNSGESSLVNERPAFLKEAQEILDHNHDFKSETRAQFYFAEAADAVQTDLAKSSDYAEKAVHLFRNLPPSDRMASALNLLGVIQNRQKNFHEAIESLSEGASLIQSQGGETRHSLPAIYAHLADAHLDLLEIPEAEKYHHLALDTAVSLKGEEHEDVFQTKYRLGAFLVLTSRPTQGLALLHQALDLALRTKGPDDGFHVPMLRAGYSSALLRYGLVDDSVAAVSPAIEAWRRAKRSLTRDFAAALERTAQAETILGHFNRSAALLEEAGQVHSKVGDTTASGRMDDYIFARATLLAVTGHSQDAMAALNTIAPPPLSGTEVSFAWLDYSTARADVAFEAGRFSEAIDHARDVRLRLTSSRIRTYFKRYEAPAALDEGKALLFTGRSSEALPLLQRAVQLGSEVYDQSRSPFLADSHVALADCLTNLGRREEAQSLLARAQQIDGTYKELSDEYKRPLRQLATRLGRRP